MSPKEKAPGGIFAGKTAPGSKQPSAPAPGQKKIGGAGKRPERKPARPLKEYNERLAKEQARAKGSKRSLRERIAAVMPLFGVIGVREIGLAVTIISAVTLIWILRQYAWGLLVVGLGFVLMRYGDNWLKGQ